MINRADKWLENLAKIIGWLKSNFSEKKAYVPLLRASLFLLAYKPFGFPQALYTPLLENPIYKPFALSITIPLYSDDFVLYKPFLRKSIDNKLEDNGLNSDAGGDLRFFYTVR